MCVSLLLMQTGAEPLATEVGGPRVASVPCCTHHCTQSAAALSRAVADKGSAEVLAQFPHNQCLRRSGDVDFQAPFTSWWPSQGVLPEKPLGAEQRGTASQQGLSSQNPTPSCQKRS